MSAGGRPSPGSGVADELVASVEATGLDATVTLIVSGIVVTGAITSWGRYARWLTEVIMRAKYEGGSAALPPGGPPDFPELRAKDAAEWRATYPAGGASSDRFALADAEIRSGPPANWIRVPFLVILSSAVTALSVATPGGAE